MRYPLFSEIAHDNDPVLNAYEQVFLVGGGGNPMSAAISAHVEVHGGDANSPEVKIAVRDRLIDALLPQIHNLWQYFEDATRESEQYKQYFEEKMDQVASLNAEAVKRQFSGAYRLGGPPGNTDGSGGGDSGDA